MTKYVLDTNALLSNPEVLDREDFIITSMVLREIEHLELKKMDRTLQFQVRRAKRAINKLLDDSVDVVDITDFNGYIDGGFSADYADNVIVEYARVNGYGIITNDILMKLKAKAFDIEIIEGESVSVDEEDYKGFIEKVVSREEFTKIYFNLEDNSFDLKVNQYLSLIDEETGQTLDVLKWNGKYLISIANKEGILKKKLQTGQFGKFETKDKYQVMALDSIEHNQLTMIRGKAGSGKSLIALNTAWRLVEEKGYKLVIFFNPAPSKDAIEIGFLPGTSHEKALGSSLGSMLKSKFGNEEEVYHQITKGNIEIFPFVELRGWDSGDFPTVVWVSESQNLTAELLKLGLQRIAENTKVIIDGDFHQQVDKEVYAHDNGMKKASEVFRGSDLYGEVELQNIYRSRLADIADGM